MDSSTRTTLTPQCGLTWPPDSHLVLALALAVPVWTALGLWAGKFMYVPPGWTAAITTAMERGEVQGRGGSWVSWKVLNPHFIEEKKIKLLAQGGLRKDPDLPNVPMISDFARSKEDRNVVRLVVALPIGISRAIMTPPDVPKDRIEALRRAFDATMTDPELLASAKSRSIPISPSTGEVVEARVAEIMSASPAMIERAKFILGYTKAK